MILNTLALILFPVPHQCGMLHAKPVVTRQKIMSYVGCCSVFPSKTAMQILGASCTVKPPQRNYVLTVVKSNLLFKSHDISTE